ncbi:MAG: ASPIC/UnbV domain-containing protein, partial [Terracidiphilus sp.]
KAQLQQVSGGDGFASQNDRRVHFGLGKDPKIEKAVIHWPSGFVQTLDDLMPDRLYTLKEPS